MIFMDYLCLINDDNDEIYFDLCCKQLEERIFS